MKRSKVDFKFWRKYFQSYDIVNKAYPYQILLSLVISKLSKINNCKILDAGSGTGNLSIELSKHGGEVYSLDNSKAGLDIHLAKDSTAQIYLHDLVEPLQFPDNFFDIAISLNTICFIDKGVREKIFKEFHRVLKKDGKIIVVNLLNGFKSYKIFVSHIRCSIKKDGFIKSLSTIFLLLIPALKVFYYSTVIQRQSSDRGKSFFEVDEQFIYLRKVHFKNISDNKLVFANQAILNEAYK